MQLSKNSPGALLASLISPNKNKPRLLLVTGLRGAGKTLWCQDLVGRARARGLNLCGLVSPSVFINNKKVSIGLKDLQTGEQRRLAHRNGYEDGDIQTQDFKLVHHYVKRVILMEKDRLILDGKIAPASGSRIHAEGFVHVAS